MGHVVILGAGVMGSAMTLPIDARGHSAHLLGTHLDTDIIRSVAGNGMHPGLKITLPASVRADDWTALPDAMEAEPDMLILGVSSAGIDWALTQLAGAMTRPVPILMITKGLSVSDGEIEVLPTILRDALKSRLGFAPPISAVAGPAIAAEQAAARETSVVFTGTDMAEAAGARDMLVGGVYHVEVSDDMIGVELCAALKNFFALGVGTAAGQLERVGEAPNGAQMHNAVASLFTRAVAELGDLVAGLGGDPATVLGLAGVGDLHVTCRAGRNSRMGRLLGLGLPYSRAKAEHMAADTVEGADLAIAIGPTLRTKMESGALDANRLPLTRAILGAICDDAPFPQTLGALYAS